MTFYRNVVWFAKGLREYTKNGYIAAEKSFDPKALDVDVSSRSFMITGANSGIGKDTAVFLAKKGAIVHMVCRSETRGEEARKEISESSGNDKVILHILDMSKPRMVWEFVEKFSSANEALHVLINNAGCMVNTREVDEDGLEKNFATNTLGTYILTSGLMPLLLKNEAPRVITVSSGGMLVMKLDIKDLQFEKMNPFDGTMAYAQNKRQQVIMTEKWAEKHEEILFSSMHPGWADTPAVQTSMPGFHRKMKDRLRTCAQGADTIIWLSVADMSKEPRGAFYQDRKPVSTHLPLAWSKASDGEKNELMTKLEDLASKFKPDSSPN